LQPLKTVALLPTVTAVICHSDREPYSSGEDDGWMGCRRSGASPIRDLHTGAMSAR